MEPPEAEPEAEPEAVGEDGEIGDGTAAGEPWAEEEAEEEEIILPAEPALCVKYIGTLGNFLLTLDGIDSKKIFECSWDIPMPMQVIAAHEHPITSIVSSSSGDHILTGCRGGVVQVRDKDLSGSTHESNKHHPTATTVRLAGWRRRSTSAFCSPLVPTATSSWSTCHSPR